MKIFQGTIRCCCEHAKNNNNNSHHQPPSPPPTLQQLPQQQQSLVELDKNTSYQYTPPCLYSSKEFCNVLLECINLNSKFCETNLMHPNADVPIVSNVVNATAINNNNSNKLNNNSANVNVPVYQTKKKVTPTVSINVTDTENLNVCMCSLYASYDNVLIEQESMIGTICPRCQNIIKQQPTEHRKTLISKRLQLSKDIIVNRVDTHFLSLKNAFDHCKRYEPYTPESVESHSPILPEQFDILEYEQNDDDDDDDNIGIHAGASDKNIINDANSLNVINDNAVDPFDVNCKIVPVRTMSTHSSAVSPRQLKSRLEILRKTSTDASGMVISSHIAENRKNRLKRGFCFNRCCCIL